MNNILENGSILQSHESIQFSVWMFNLQHYYVIEHVSDVQSTFGPCCLIVATVWPCRSIVCLCACCCSKCSGLCAAWTPLSSPTSWTPSSPWSWPGTFKLTHRVKIFNCRRTPQASDYFATLTECFSSVLSFLRTPEDVLHSFGSHHDLLNGWTGAISSLWYGWSVISYIYFMHHKHSSTHFRCTQ